LSAAKVDVSLLLRLAELLLNVEAVPKPGQVEQARALVEAAALRKGDPVTVAALRARLSGEMVPARKPDEAADEARRQAVIARVEKAVAAPAITPDEVLRVSDEAFTADARSPLILASRWQACRKLGLEAEALRVAAVGLALDPTHPALKEPGDWLGAQLGEARSLYTAARGLRKEGKTKEALDALERVLQIDPAFADARLELAGVLAGLEVREAAVFHLELAVTTGLSPSLERQAVAVATELGAWRALFSLAGKLSEINPRDAEMQHLCALAATALGRTSFALETAGALTEHPIYGLESWVLRSAARVTASSKKLETPPYFNVSSRHLSPESLLWFAVSLHLSVDSAAAWAQFDKDLPTGVNAELKPFLDALRGRTSLQQIIALRDDPVQGARARWVLALLNSLTPDERVREDLLAASTDQRLPLIARAAAAGRLAALQPEQAPATVLPTDPFYVPGNAADLQSALQLALPGQRVVLSGELNELASVPRIARIEGSAFGHRTLKLSEELKVVARPDEPGAVLELSGLNIGDPKRSSAGKIVVNGRTALLMRDLGLFGVSLVIDGAAGLGRVSLATPGIEVAAGAILHGDGLAVSGPVAVQGRLQTDAERWSAFAGHIAALGKDARVDLARAHLLTPDTGIGHLAAVSAGLEARVTLGEAVVYSGSEAPLAAAFGGRVTATALRYVGPGEAGTVREGGVVELPPAPAGGPAPAGPAAPVQVTDLASLTAALAAATPGTVIDLPEATIRLTAPLQVPAGVTLRGKGWHKSILASATSVTPRLLVMRGEGTRRIVGASVKFDYQKEYQVTLPERERGASAIEVTGGTLVLQDAVVDNGDALSRSSARYVTLRLTNAIVLALASPINGFAFTDPASTLLNYSPRNGLSTIFSGGTMICWPLPATTTVLLEPTTRFVGTRSEAFVIDDGAVDPADPSGGVLAEQVREEAWQTALQEFDATLKAATGRQQMGDAAGQFERMVKAAGGSQGRMRAFLLDNLRKRLPSDPVATTLMIFSTDVADREFIDSLPPSVRDSTLRLAADLSSSWLWAPQRSLEQVLVFRNAYPTGSRYEAEARRALLGGKTLVEFQKEVVAMEERRRAELVRLAEERKRAEAQRKAAEARAKEEARQRALVVSRPAHQSGYSPTWRAGEMRELVHANLQRTEDSNRRAWMEGRLNWYKPR
jgi:tetratricopeptide (TPR) repeat protein